MGPIYIWGHKSSRERFLDPNPQTSCALYSQSKQKEAWPENGIMYQCLHSNFQTILVEFYNGLLRIFHFHSCNGNKQRFFTLYKCVIREQKHDKIHLTNLGFFSVPCLLSHCPTPTNSVAAGNLLLMHGQPNICKQCTEVE